MRFRQLSIKIDHDEVPTFLWPDGPERTNFAAMNFNGVFVGVVPGGPGEGFGNATGSEATSLTRIHAHRAEECSFDVGRDRMHDCHGNEFRCSAAMRYFLSDQG